MATGTTGPGSPVIAAGAYDNTGNVFLDVLVGWGWLDVGHDRNITYYFDQTSPYHQWSNFEMGTWRAALQEWVNVANITTQEVSSASGADLLETWSNPQTLTNQFGLDPTGFPWEAAHYLPHPEGDSPGEYDYIYQLSDYSQSALTPGANGYRIFVHEIGHALGLSHPHGMVQLDNEPTFPGVSASGDMGDFGYNQMVYAIMSYNRGTYVNRFNDYGQPAAPMAFDIAAIQFLYGPNIDIWQIVNGHWTASSDVGSHPAGWAPAGIGDFNHDGTSDIAWYNPATGDIDIWQIVNGHWSASSDVGTHPLGSTPAGIGDFNHDGTDDIAWYNSTTGAVDIWQIVNAHWAASVSPGSHPLA